MPPCIEVLPLGAGQDVGRSCCIVRMAGCTVMFDCGAHFGFRDSRRFPEFGLLSRAGRFTELVDAVVITHFHTDHLGALPYFTEVCGYRGPILMTYPTFAIAPIMLEDYVKVNADRPGERLPYNERHVRDCLRRVTAVDLHQPVVVRPGLSFTFYYAGHVLGAAMVYMTAGHLTALYTGDFNSSPDRHLGPAEPLTPPGGPSGAPLRRPDVLISEATYAASLRDSKRARERDLLAAVVDTVSAGGKVLIPTFAMGRAQELLMLVTDCWERNGLQVPIYFSSAMASRALMYYQLLLNWTNANVRRTIFGGSSAAMDTPLAANAAAAAADTAARLRTKYHRPYEPPRGDICGDGGSGGGGEASGGGLGAAGAGFGEGAPLLYDSKLPCDDDDDDDDVDCDDDGDAEGDYGDGSGQDNGVDEAVFGGAGGGEDGEDRPAVRSESGSGEERGGDVGVDRHRLHRRRRRRYRREPVLPSDIVPDGAAPGAAVPAAVPAAASAGPDPGGHGRHDGGSGRGSFARGAGVFSEADVYGMFRARPWDRSLLHAPGPAVLFASPGNITSGVSLEAFRAWAGSSKNLLVLAGYQVRGTLGSRLESIQNQGQSTAAGAATVDVPTAGGGPGDGGGGGGGGSSSRVEVRCRIKMLAFSAHADLRGLLGLVRRVGPRAVVLVHGQREPMEFLRGRIQSHLGIECHVPPTGNTVTISPRRAVPLGVRPQLVAAASCAAGRLAAQAAAVAVASAATCFTAAGDGGGQGCDLPVELGRLRPQPLAALPLSGVVVARVVPPSPQLQPALPLPPPVPAPQQQAQLQGPSSGDGGGGGATQLTLTDSGTAARVLLAAHQAALRQRLQAQDQEATPIKPYKITYSCKLFARLQAAAAAAAGASTAAGTACGGIGGGGGEHRMDEGGAAGAEQRDPGVPVCAAAEASCVAVVAEALARAEVAVIAAVGGYAAGRKLQVESGEWVLSFGTFRAQLSLVSDPDGQGQDLNAAAGSGDAVMGETVEVVAAGGHEERGQQGQQSEGREALAGAEGEARGPLLQIACEWPAAEDAAACRCLQALRGAFGITAV